jgi:hypothetical protein
MFGRWELELRILGGIVLAVVLISVAIVTRPYVRWYLYGTPINPTYTGIPIRENINMGDLERELEEMKRKE